MTDEEATKIAKIMLTADSWCSTCSSDLLDQMKQAFPDHKSTFEHVERRESELEEAFRAERKRREDADDFTPPQVWTL